MKCDYKSSWKVNEWNLEESSGNGRRFPESDFWFCSWLDSAHLKHILLSEWDDVVAFPQTWEAPLRKRMSYLVVSLFMRSFLKLAGCLTECLTYISLFLSLLLTEFILGILYTHEETCVAVKLLKYHLFNTMDLNIFWYMNSEFSSGSVSFHAVNVRLLPTGFFIASFADPLRRSIRIIRNLCITGWKNIDVW